MKRRTDAEIIKQTNKLARRFYSMKGYKARKDFKFYDESEARHPDEQLCWRMAVDAQHKYYK